MVVVSGVSPGTEVAVVSVISVVRAPSAESAGVGWSCTVVRSAPVTTRTSVGPRSGRTARSAPPVM